MSPPPQLVALFWEAVEVEEVGLLGGSRLGRLVDF